MAENESAERETTTKKRVPTLKRVNIESNLPLEKTANKRRRIDPKTVDSSSMSEVKVETGASSSLNNMPSIVDLPPEILQAILQHVDTVDLLKCRQTNRQFYEIASQVMGQRADIQLRFGFEKGHFMHSIKYRHCEKLLVNVCKAFDRYDTKSLKDLVDCLKESNGHFPCTSFRFDALAQFQHEDMESFMSIWGEHIFALKIELDDVPKNVVVLRDLLINKVKNLKKLELRFCEDKTKTPTQRSVESEGFQLPKLQALFIDNRYRKYRGFIESILAAARNLKHFELTKSFETRFVVNIGPEEVHEENMVDPRHSIIADDLAMLQNFNKLHCLKNARIYLTDDLIAYLQKLPSSLDLKLQSLALSLKSSIWKKEQLKSGATEVINRLLSSSKTVMHELSVEPLGLLPGLVIPILGKLQKLHLFAWLQMGKTEYLNIFPPLFEMADIFPNLKELDMHSLGEKTFDQSKPLKPMKNVEVLRLFGGSDESAKSKEWLMKATPNVKTLLMVEDDFQWENKEVQINFGVIAENLTKLESFGWQLCRTSYQELLHSLDAVVTGFPESFCRKMSAKFWNKDVLTANELASCQLENRAPSILDLHELKHLDVNFFLDFDAYCEMKEDDGSDSGDESDKEDICGNDPTSMLYETGFSKVSKFLAFDLMPNLKVRTHKRME